MRNPTAPSRSSTIPARRGMVFLVLCGLALGVSACGGGSYSSTHPPPSPSQFTIGGTVSGLAGTGLVLQDNGGDNLAVSANGSFTFKTPVTSGGAYSGGASYSVTVLTQPSSPVQTCVVTNGSGMATAKVSNVQATCTTPPPVTTSFDVTGAGTAAGQGTQGIAIDDANGAIAGWYIDGSNVRHGFLRAPDGTITKFDVSVAGAASGEGTFPESISSGAIAGVYVDANRVNHSFLRASDGTITTYDVPSAGTNSGQGTQGFNINATGEIAGFYVDGSNVSHGFLRAADGTITTFDVSGAGTGPGQGTQMGNVDHLNATGAISGGYVDANSVRHGYMRASDGTITKFDVPSAGTGAGQGTFTSGINATGTITGAYVDASSLNHGYVRAANGTITTFDVSGAAGQITLPENINASGAIVGQYVDTKGVNHGFVRAPDGTITTFDAPGAGTGSGQGTIPNSNDAAGNITGWYVDASNVNHGFVRTP